MQYDVARWKWKAGQPIADPEREGELLQRVVERGRGKGLHPDLARSFFVAQMAAARLVQQADFNRWEAEDIGPFVDATSLEVLRRRIDSLNVELIDTLVKVRPWLLGQTTRQSLPQRTAEILTRRQSARRAAKRRIAPLRSS